MKPFTCPCCDKTFDHMPLDIAFKHPDPYLRVPENERAARCSADDDYCVIDKSLYFIRGFLAVRIHDMNETFGWGFWCKVSKDDYMHYCRTSYPGSLQGKPFVGYIANTARGYDGIEGLKVRVQPIAPDKRPTLTLEPCNHPLYREQVQGITMTQVHAINSTMFPDRF